ncbi:N-acetylmuramoyl-L-alanine amidase [Peptoclostridium litorale DSM 5388]|uniref:N-acetylmuramoyl-L-alanine amidase AmiA n=1 Tax=Peptoclostridium litorale DSM 5388 TaxID=1121324 RepID=A0A069RHR4_PEPLI|nr:N-acetylmuramoyl-L-alanine amidase [Peptoclostridium litorale]KDR95675.1 N-acetylmuramoyl-L-alanine amidase AmiA [Peptoclostridium litorale DSM 5388]SIO00831.1 N-acetylmuramoyl-L-alanine amidase [Peptoclostridium litorale DSM 5388]
MTRCKLSFIFVLLTAIMISFGISYAAEDVEMKTFIIDEKEKRVPIVNVELEGKKVKSDVPPIILNDRTLLPVRAVAESMGCNVRWNPDTYEVTLEKEYKVIKLKIDSAKVEVNGEIKTLPDNVPAKIVTYEDAGRTMVPARFILEELGAQVDWDAGRRTVMLKKPKSYFVKEQEACVTLEDIIWTNNSIKIKTSAEPKFNDKMISGPDRLVVDLENTRFDLLYETLEVGSDSVSKIRASQFETEPMVSRVVFDLEDYVDYDISTEEDGILVSFASEDKQDEISQAQEEMDILEAYKKSYGDFSSSDDGDGENENAQTDSKEEAHDNPLGVEIEGTQSDQTFLLSATNDIKTNVIFLDSPERIAIDIVGAKIADKQYEDKQLSGSYVKGIRSYYYKDEDRTRIVFTMAEGIYNSELLVLKDSSEVKLLKVKPPVKEGAGNGVKTIVLDAGHGGHDPGATGMDTKVTEKSIALDMVKRLRPMLQAEGYNVVLTRDSDEFIDLYRRPAIANEIGADLFISVHVNATDSRQASGIEVLYYPETKRVSREIDVQGMSAEQVQKAISAQQSQTTRNNKQLAQIMQKSLVDATGAVSRGIVERPRLVVIRETAMPAILAEIGFASNPNEERLLQTDEYKDKLARAMVNGVKGYFEKQ